MLVEFWAPWCGPCRLILPVIGKLSKTYEGKLECYKINTDENPDIANQYGIRSIPTIIVFKNGEKKDAVIGAVPESTLISCIEKMATVSELITALLLWLMPVGVCVYSVVATIVASLHETISFLYVYW